MAETRTDPGDRGVAELEREVDQERARLSATIDALQSKASLGNIVDEVMKVVRENGGDMGRNLGRTVRDNPLPALLTGVGLAWLMMGSGRPAERWYDEDDRPYRGAYRDRTIPVGDRGSGSALLDSGEEMAGKYDAGNVYNADALGDERQAGPGLAERTAGAMADVGARASEAVSGLGERASHMAHAAGARMSSAGEAAWGAGDAARARLAQARRGAAHAGTDARQTFDDLLEEQPLVLGALALAVGAAIGGALPASRAENRVFGARSDQAKEALRKVAGEEGRKLQATAAAVVEEAGSIVEETSAELAGAMPEGSTVADAAAERINEAAARLRDAATEEAERQNLGGAVAQSSEEGEDHESARSTSQASGEPDREEPGRPGSEA
jgi:hypothetical protein